MAAPLTFVVADDSPIFQKKVAQYLRSGGYEVVSIASNGLDVVAACERHRPDAVILDWNMPPGSGAQAALDILQAGAVRHVIITTSHSVTRDIKPLRDAGAFFIKKPFQREEFLQRIQGVIQRADDGSPTGT